MKQTVAALFAFIGVLWSTNSQVRFSASLDTNNITIGDHVHLTLSAENTSNAFLYFPTADEFSTGNAEIISQKQDTSLDKDGKILKTEQNIATAYYVIQPEDTYVRTRIDLNGRDFLYLNPITRHPTSIVYDNRLDSINMAQTWLYWLVYAVSIVAIIWYVIKKTKEKMDKK